MLCFIKLVVSKSNNNYIGKVQRSGSGVELRTLDKEDPGSNPVLPCKTLGKFVHSTLLQFSQLIK